MNTLERDLQKLTIVCSDFSTINCIQERCKLVELVQSTLENNSFQTNFNKFLSSKKCVETSNILNNLIETLIDFIEFQLKNNNFINTHFSISNAILCLEKVTNLNIKTFLRLKISAILKLLNIIVNDSSDSAHRVICIALKMSEHKLYGNIDFTNEFNDINQISNSLNSIKIRDNTVLDSYKLKMIESNLKELSIQERLKQLDSSSIEETSVLKDVRFISILLNNQNSSIYFDWNLFTQYKSFRAFTRILEYFIDKLKQHNTHNDDIDADQTIYRPLRDVLEIIYKIGSHSMRFSRNFLEQNLIKIILDLFNKENLIEFLYESYVPILIKLVSIFYFLAKQALYSKVSNNNLYDDEIVSLGIIKKCRNKFERLTKSDQSLDNLEKFKTYFIYVLYLVSLTYLQAKLEPDSSLKLLDFRHYEDIVKKGFLNTTYISFRKITNEFVQNEKIQWEFINENNEEETQHLTRLIFINNTNSAMGYTIVDVINNIKNSFTTNETKKLAFPEYVSFFKSIIYYGLDIEKIICLSCLRSFCSEQTVKNYILEDEAFIKFLENLKQSRLCIEEVEENSFKPRLKAMIENLFNYLIE